MCLPGVIKNVHLTLSSLFIVLGLKVQQKDKYAPQHSFSYALTPFMDKCVPLDWTVIVSEDIVCKHVRCYELQKDDDISTLVTTFRKQLAVAIVLINKDNSYDLPKVSCTSLERGSYPVIVVKGKEGLNLLRIVEQHSESLDLHARVDIENPPDVKQVKIGKLHC